MQQFSGFVYTGGEISGIMRMGVLFACKPHFSCWVTYKLIATSYKYKLWKTASVIDKICMYKYILNFWTGL